MARVVTHEATQEGHAREGIEIVALERIDLARAQLERKGDFMHRLATRLARTT